MRDFIGVRASRVLDVDSDIETAVGCFFDGQARVFERGVAEAVTEGEERVDFLLVEPAIADVDAFAVSGLSVDALHGALGVFGVGGGIVFKAFAPSDR